MPSCSIFQEKIITLGAERETIASLLATYPAIGEQEILDEVKQRTENLRAERLRFFEEEYAPRVKAIMAAWCSSTFSLKQTRSAFLGAIDVTQQGRILLLRAPDIHTLAVPEGHLNSCYFPHLMERVAQNLELKSVFIENVDHLSSVDGTLFFYDAEIGSMGGLQKVGCSLIINSADIPPLRKLEEVHEHILLAKAAINNFRDQFPQLRKVGMDDRGVSFVLSDKNAHLKEQLEELRREGSLAFGGSIRIASFT